MRTQKELARLLNITPQHLNAVLKGRVRPSLKLALQIERAMGIPPEKFIPELGEVQPNDPVIPSLTNVVNK